MKENELQQIFKQMLLAFDFEQVQKIMRMLNWTWILSKNNQNPPTIKEMEDKCKDLFEMALHDFKKNELFAEAYGGGFYVTIFQNKNIEIRFVPVLLQYMTDTEEIV